MLGMRGAALLVKVDWLNLRSLIMRTYIHYMQKIVAFEIKDLPIS